MTCITNSQAVVLATAMAVTSTVLFFAFAKQKSDSSPDEDHESKQPQQHTLRSCLYLEEKKRQRKKKKKVHFAENVKDTAGDGDEYRKVHDKKFTKKLERTCRNEIRGMPANRVALYNGILRDRVHGMGFSY